MWPSKIPRAPRSKERLGPQRQMLSRYLPNCSRHVLKILLSYFDTFTTVGTFTKSVFLNFHAFTFLTENIMKYILLMHFAKKSCLSHEAGGGSIPFPFLKIQFRYSSRTGWESWKGKGVAEKQFGIQEIRVVSFFFNLRRLVGRCRAPCTNNPPSHPTFNRELRKSDAWFEFPKSLE